MPRRFIQAYIAFDDEGDDWRPLAAAVDHLINAAPPSELGIMLGDKIYRAQVFLQERDAFTWPEETEAAPPFDPPFAPPHLRSDPESEEYERARREDEVPDETDEGQDVPF